MKFYGVNYKIILKCGICRVCGKYDTSSTMEYQTKRQQPGNGSFEKRAVSAFYFRMARHNKQKCIYTNRSEEIRKYGKLCNSNILE